MLQTHLEPFVSSVATDQDFQQMLAGMLVPISNYSFKNLYHKQKGLVIFSDIVKNSMINSIKKIFVDDVLVCTWILLHPVIESYHQVIQVIQRSRTQAKNFFVHFW